MGPWYITGGTTKERNKGMRGVPREKDKNEHYEFDDGSRSSLSHLVDMSVAVAVEMIGMKRHSRLLPMTTTTTTTTTTATLALKKQERGLRVTQINKQKINKTKRS